MFSKAINNANRRQAIFLIVIGLNMYTLLQNLISSGTFTGKTIGQLISMLNAHFVPAPSVIVKCYRFNSRVQWAGESIVTFITELQVW